MGASLIRQPCYGDRLVDPQVFNYVVAKASRLLSCICGAAWWGYGCSRGHSYRPVVGGELMSKASDREMRGKVVFALPPLAHTLICTVGHHAISPTGDFFFSVPSHLHPVIARLTTAIHTALSARYAICVGGLHKTPNAFAIYWGT